MNKVHMPVLAESSTPGVWNVYCSACSDMAGDYVYPCAKWEAPAQVVAAERSTEEDWRAFTIHDSASDEPAAVYALCRMAPPAEDCEWSTYEVGLPTKGYLTLGHVVDAARKHAADHAAWAAEDALADGGGQ